MMMVKCEICGKTCNDIMAIKFRSGYMCTDCSRKFDAMLGSNHNLYYNTEQYKEFLRHPASTLKIKKSGKKAKHACCVCGKDDLKAFTADQQPLCAECVESCITVSDEYVNDKEKFFSKHDATYFKEELSECYSPCHNITFNYKTQKVYLKDALRKKNYKMVDFSDVLAYRVWSDYDKFSDKIVRKLKADIRYNGGTMCYYRDDSINNYEFDMIVDCFSRIPHLCNVENFSSVSGNGGEINTENIQNQNNFPQLTCPRCGSPNCTPIVETSTSGRDFSSGKGCCGWLLLGPIGILCGACGEGKKVNSTTYWMCSNCGNKFQK